MKTNRAAQSATSLPKAPREDADSRFAKYMVMMGIRIACFVAMAVVTPYGWYTFVFAAGAIFLPYLAVIVANVGQDAADTTAISPERGIEAPRPAPAAAAAGPDAPVVIRIAETPRLDAPPRRPLVSGAPVGEAFVDDAPAECSRAGCRETAVWAIRWRNPRIHAADRRKTWVACDEHVAYLREFLTARDFPVEVGALAAGSA